jgi:hypothetical protein
MVYPALLPLMRTPRLPVVDWTEAPNRFKWTRPFRRKTKSGFCACHHISTGFYQLRSVWRLGCGLCNRRIVFRYPTRTRDFPFSEISRPVLAATLAHIQWVAAGGCWLERPRLQALHSPLRSVIRNEWSHTCPSQYTFMALPFCSIICFTVLNYFEQGASFERNWKSCSEM